MKIKNPPNYSLAPIKAAIGYVRFVCLIDGQHYSVEKMSYEEEDIDRHPSVVMNATSKPCGIDVIRDGGAWVVRVGGAFHSRHEDKPTLSLMRLIHSYSWDRVVSAVVEMSVLDWLTMVSDGETA